MGNDLTENKIEFIKGFLHGQWMGGMRDLVMIIKTDNIVISHNGKTLCFNNHKIKAENEKNFGKDYLTSPRLKKLVDDFVEYAEKLTDEVNGRKLTDENKDDKDATL